jgi:hypothetical protein
MFVLPAIVLPFIFILAVYRLYQIPTKLLSGELQVPAHRRILLSVADLAAYLMLLGYTVALSVGLVHAIFFAADHLSAYLSLAVYVFAYPLVYMAAAWIFYYGLKPGSRNTAE